MKPRSRGTRRPNGAGTRDRKAVDGRKKPYPVWVVTLCAFVLPGSGQMLNGDPVRGIIMQFFMLLGGFITYQVTGPQISIIGRLAGGIAVYVFTVLDANGIAKRRAQAWERLQSEPKAGPHARPDERPATASRGRRSGQAGVAGKRGPQGDKKDGRSGHGHAPTAALPRRSSGGFGNRAPEEAAAP